MAYVNSPNYQQEMVEMDTEASNYTSLTQRREDEATYSEIRPHERIQINTEPPRKEFMCNVSKLILVLIIVAIVALAALLSSIVTTVLLKQNMDNILMDMKNEIQVLKRNRSGDVVSINHKETTWSPWSPWRSCSVTCNGGIRSRTRTCDGVGSCLGNNVDFSGCNSNVCLVEEITWSPWSPWGSCSVTCNGGIRRRTRTCDGEGSCSGNNVDFSGCNNNVCANSNYNTSDPMVYFAVNQPNGTLTTAGRPFFTWVVSNHGGAYNLETAVFTAPAKGLYHFSFTFLQDSTLIVGCNIYHNSNYITRAYTGSINHVASASVSVYLYLDIGDTVDLRYCENWQYASKAYGTIFTGALIMPS